MYKNLLDALSSYKFFIQYYLTYLIFSFVFRLYLSINYTEFEVLTFVYGIRMDTIAVFAFMLIPILLYSINLFRLSAFSLAFASLILIYLEISNVFFFEEFQTRLNYIFLEYLDHPEVVASMLWESYKFYFIFLIPLIIFVVYKIYILSYKAFENKKFIYKLALLPLIIAILFLGIRSGWGSATPNPSFYSFSNSTIKNSIANNTIFSLIYAKYAKSKENMPNYGVMSEDLGPIKNQIISSTHTKKKNVIVNIVESFGHSYVGVMGGTPTTPEFDKLSQEGLFFDNMYASSSRTNRGIEAIVSSIYPFSRRTYLKLPKSQNNFWTMAKTFKENGYKTIFIYGGDSTFDNMRSFAYNNGYDEIIDKKDYDKSIKRFTWGVNDEELYKKVLQTLKSNDKPLFITLMTLSSHKPFDYPDGKIVPYEKANVASFENSIKYADFALGRFVENLKKRDFFNDSILAITADHNAHVHGNEVVPVQDFRVPALFLSNELKPKSSHQVTHHVDIAPTIIDLAGIVAEIPAQGNNLLKAESSRALVTFHNCYAYIKDEGKVIYEKNKAPKGNKELVNEGLNLIYKSYERYEKKLHN